MKLPSQARSERMRIARAACLYAALATLGLVARLSGAVDVGWALLAVGGGGLLWQGRAALMRLRRERAIREAQERRERLRSARKARAVQEKAQRASHRQAKALAKQRNEEARRRLRQEEQQQRSQEKAVRQERDARLNRETARLLRLSDAALMEEVRAAFAARGFAAESVGPEAACDLRLTEPGSGRIEVARVAPQGRIVAPVDVQAMEAWRQAERAQRGYLVALSGFQPAAVRSAENLPLTLVEAYLLAAWRFSALAAPFLPTE